jgi:hypothetical protein
MVCDPSWGNNMLHGTTYSYNKKQLYYIASSVFVASCLKLGVSLNNAISPHEISMLDKLQILFIPSSSQAQDWSTCMAARHARWLSINEGRLFVCLVLFVLMRPTEPGCFTSRSWSLWKALEEEGCMGLVPWRFDLQCKSSWILNDFFTENQIKS